MLGWHSNHGCVVLCAGCVAGRHSHSAGRFAIRQEATARAVMASKARRARAAERATRAIQPSANAWIHRSSRTRHTMNAFSSLPTCPSSLAHQTPRRVQQPRASQRVSRTRVLPSILPWASLAVERSRARTMPCCERTQLQQEAARSRAPPGTVPRELEESCRATLLRMGVSTFHLQGLRPASTAAQRGRTDAPGARTSRTTALAKHVRPLSLAHQTHRRGRQPPEPRPVTKTGAFHTGLVRAWWAARRIRASPASHCQPSVATAAMSSAMRAINQ